MVEKKSLTSERKLKKTILYKNIGEEICYRQK